MVIFVGLKGRLYPVFLGLCCLVSALSVSVCVGCHLIIEHSFGLIHAPENFGGLQNENQNALSDLPAEPSVDDRGLTVISDTATVQNFLLVGIDARTPGQPCRSDAMILISLNCREKKIIACSLLRDILVSVEGHGQNRLNSAYSFGGIDLLRRTLKTELNIDVPYYVSVDFSSFSQIIDILGGVEITVSSEEAKTMNEMCRQSDSGVSQIPLKDGTYHLNGVQALSYARDRSSSGGDFDRTERQRRVLGSLIQKLQGASSLQLLNLFMEVLPNITTDIPQDRLKDLVSHLPEYLNYQPVFISLPQIGTYSFITFRTMAVIDIDFEANIRYLSEQIYS